MLLPPEIAEELELIAAEAQRGEPAGPMLCRRLERDVTALLYRRIPGLRVRAEVVDGGVHVTLLVPQRGKPVQHVVLTFARTDGPSSGGGRFKL